MTDVTPQPEPAPVPEPEELLRALWALTPENLRGKLPKPYNKNAEKGKCGECGGYHGLPALHLDYLGHADTCRLIAEKDIYWQWEPKAGWDAETGEPKFVRDRQGYPIALWIDLTICGVTRPGVGTVTGGKSDPEKELIGDAIRNAAMRFGVGADMWSKAHHAEAAADDAPERTYDRRPAVEVDPEAWFKENGWDGKDDHDAVREFVRQTAGAMDAKAKEALKAWQKNEGLDWTVPWTRDQVNAFSHKLDLLAQPSNAPDPSPTPETPAPLVADIDPEAVVAYLKSLNRFELIDQFSQRQKAANEEWTDDKMRQKLGLLLLAEGWRPPAVPPTASLLATNPTICGFCGTDGSDANPLVDYGEDGKFHARCHDERLADRAAAEDPGRVF